MIINEGKYLTAKKAKQGAFITFKDEGIIQDNNKYKYDDGNPKKDFIFTVEYEREDTLLRLNKASRVSCIEAWGKDTAKWIGKQASLIIMPTPSGSDKMIVLQPVREMNPADIQF